MRMGLHLDYYLLCHPTTTGTCFSADGSTQELTLSGKLFSAAAEGNGLLVDGVVYLGLAWDNFIRKP